MSIWAILGIIAASCVIILIVLIMIGLKAGKDYDDRMHDICKGKLKHFKIHG